MLKSKMVGRPALRAIRDLERVIRVWELVRDRTQQLVNLTTACDEKQRAVETNPGVAKSRAKIAAYNRAIIRARARINELENEDEAAG
jgi:mevalonate pyrophosphate decarboxylase